MADQPDTPAGGEPHPLVGQLIGERYRIDALLGEGGMGAVFRATHLSLGRPVAVKLLHPRLTADEHIAKRFDREALAVSKLDHPNCVQVIDFGTTPKGMKYLVMQFLEGRELRDLTGVGLPIEQVVYYGIQVLRALEHAHKRGLVHRDLKPENIFLVQDDDGNEVVKLVDFGIVKLLEDAPQEKLTRMGMAFGTPTYMSPEQAAGGKIDARTDLYAVGVLLYELLTGMPPFDADEPGILLRMHILADPPPLPDTVPKAVVAVVTKLLAKEPDDRYADAREARRALAAAYKLPSTITGLVGFAAVAADDSVGDGPGDSLAGAAIPALVVAAAAADASTGPPTRMLDPVAAQAQSPTAAQAQAETRAEPTPSEAPELFARSGGTVLAPPTGQVPSASMSHGSMPTPMPVAGASMSHGSMSTPMPVAAASMSHGSVPIVPPGPVAPRFDPLAVSSPGLPVMGAHPYSGAYGAVPPPTQRRPAGRGTGTVIVVVLLLVTWIAIGLVWLSGRDDEAEGAAAPATTTPAGAGGLYRFSDDKAPAGVPVVGAPTEDSAGTPSTASTPSGTPTGSPTDTKGPPPGKGNKKVKKPKRDDDD